jgi:glycosyltransferase involved in cell wall biosynthesis
MTNDYGKPKISVIIPVLNGASTLAKALESIISQEYVKLELILIDGGSTDGTLDIIQHHLQYLTYWESGQDSGIADAFNRGIQKATGELIAILNSDDNWVFDTLHNLDEAIKWNPQADIYCGQICYLDETTGKSYIRKPDLSRMTQRMYLFHPSMFVRKSAYEQIGGYSEQYRLAMDAEWCHRAIAAKLKFQLVDQVLAEMRLGGVSDRNFTDSLWEYRKSLIQHNLTSRLMANYYFFKFVLFKLLMRAYPLRLLKQLVFQ